MAGVNPFLQQMKKDALFRRRLLMMKFWKDLDLAKIGQLVVRQIFICSS